MSPSGSCCNILIKYFGLIDWGFKDFCIYIHESIGLWFSFDVFVTFLYQGNVRLIKCIQNYSLLFFSGIVFVKLYYLFPKSLANFASEATGAPTFLCGKLFNYKLSFLIRYRAIQDMFFLEWAVVVCILEGIFVYFIWVTKFIKLLILPFLSFSVPVGSVLMCSLSFLMLLICPFSFILDV